MRVRLLKGNVRLSKRQKLTLRRYRQHLRKLSNRKTSVTKKRKILQTGGGFLTALLAPLAATVLLPVLRKLVS